MMFLAGSLFGTVIAFIVFALCRASADQVPAHVAERRAQFPSCPFCFGVFLAEDITAHMTMCAYRERPLNANIRVNGQ